VALNPIAGVLIRDRKRGEAETQRRERPRKEEGRTGENWSLQWQASKTRDCQQLPEAERQPGSRFSLRATGRSYPCWYLDFAFQNYRE
jgi:hypothetical protein